MAEAILVCKKLGATGRETDKKVDSLSCGAGVNLAEVL